MTLSSRIHDMPMFDKEDVGNILWCVRDSIDEWMEGLDKKFISYDDLLGSLSMQIDAHINAAHNTSSEFRGKMSKRE